MNEQRQSTVLPQETDFAAELRQKAEAHGAAQVNMQSILFQQGRAIARAYVDMMKSYAKLTAQSGRYVRQGDKMVVSGFCRIEEEHFGQDALMQLEKQKVHVLTAKLSELGELSRRTVTMRESDLFAAFCTSFSEFCTQEGIKTGSISLLVRKKDGTTEQRPLPAVISGSEHAESLGFPYQIEF